MARWQKHILFLLIAPSEAPERLASVTLTCPQKLPVAKMENSVSPSSPSVNATKTTTVQPFYTPVNLPITSQFLLQ
jgi:hypothetical protein